MLAVDELIETTTAYWQEEGLSPNIVLKTASVEAVRSLVGMGVGLATLPDMAYRPWSLDGDRLEARELANPIPTVDVGLVWRRGAPLRPTASQFLDMCREYAQSRLSRQLTPESGPEPGLPPPSRGPPSRFAPKGRFTADI